MTLKSITLTVPTFFLILYSWILILLLSLAFHFSDLSRSDYISTSCKTLDDLFQAAVRMQSIKHPKVLIDVIDHADIETIVASELQREKPRIVMIADPEPLPYGLENRPTGAKVDYVLFPGTSDVHVPSYDFWILYAIRFATQYNSLLQSEITRDRKLTRLLLAPVHRFRIGIQTFPRLEITDDATLMAVGSDETGGREQIEIWELRPEPRKVRVIPGLMRAFSPDGKLLARSGKDREKTEVIDTTTGAVVSVVPENGRIVQWAWPDRLMVVRPISGALHVSIYDVRSGNRESSFLIPSLGRVDILGPVNGRRELVVGWESTSRVEVWDLATGKTVHGITLPDATRKGIWSNFAVSSDGKRITAKRRSDQPVKIYDIATATEIGTASMRAIGSSGFPTTCEFVPGRDLILGHASWFTEDHRYFTGLRAYDLGKKAIVADLPKAFEVFVMSSDGRVMITLEEYPGTDLLIWDLTQIP